MKGLPVPDLVPMTMFSSLVNLQVTTTLRDGKWTHGENTITRAMQKKILLKDLDEEGESDREGYDKPKSLHRQQILHITKTTIKQRFHPSRFTG